MTQNIQDATNAEIIEAVKNDMLPQDRALIENAKTGIDVLSMTEDFPNVRNAFIDTLTNKVAKSLIYSKIFQNPLKELKKGKLDYGDTIEEMFVQMALAKNFGEHWDDGAPTPEADLIRKLKPKVTTMYISSNFDKKYKTTVMKKQMKKAFTSEGGLSRLVMQIVGSLTSQAEKQEFIHTKRILKDVIEGCQSWQLDADRKTETPTELKGKVVKQTPYVVDTKDDPKLLIQEIRTAVGDMQFPSTKFNLAKEENWCNPEDLILITTSATSANIDVNVLASAFNVSMTDIKTKTILVDEMPDGIFQKNAETPLVDKSPVDISTTDTLTKSAKKPKAILCDKDFLQIWDEEQGAGTFPNPEGKYTNYFADREGIFACCTFANMAIFY